MAAVERFNPFSEGESIMNANIDQQMDAAVLHAAGSPAEAIVVRTEPVPVPAAGRCLCRCRPPG